MKNESKTRIELPFFKYEKTVKTTDNTEKNQGRSQDKIEDITINTVVDLVILALALNSGFWNKNYLNPM